MLTLLLEGLLHNLGIDRRFQQMLHEMLQNRLVLRSMAYMLFDLMWEEIFPELQDVLTGGSVLDID